MYELREATDTKNTGASQRPIANVLLDVKPSGILASRRREPVGAQAAAGASKREPSGSNKSQFVARPH
jgi:hypothetical protein